MHACMYSCVGKGLAALNARKHDALGTVDKAFQFHDALAAFRCVSSCGMHAPVAQRGEGEGRGRGGRSMVRGRCVHAGEGEEDDVKRVCAQARADA